MKLLDIGPDALATTQPAFFRFRAVGDKVLLTNLEGRWVVLDDEQFGLFARGEVEEGTPLHELWLEDPDDNLVEIYARLTPDDLAEKPENLEPTALVAP